MRTGDDATRRVHADQVFEQRFERFDAPTPRLLARWFTGVNVHVPPGACLALTSPDGQRAALVPADVDAQRGDIVRLDNGAYVEVGALIGRCSSHRLRALEEQKP